MSNYENESEMWTAIAHQASEEEVLECIDSLDRNDCRGTIAYRMALSGSGRAFPRCDRHWSIRLSKQTDNQRRYPQHAPRDFDPSYAGESW